MARIVRLEAESPLKITADHVADGQWICRCGLSARFPFCDGSHSTARKETDGVLYRYRRTAAGLERIPVDPATLQTVAE